jgi:hypothetical protein
VYPSDDLLGFVETSSGNLLGLSFFRVKIYSGYIIPSDNLLGFVVLPSEDLLGEFFFQWEHDQCTHWV